jgi:predicted nuclease with TOPRIM domain
VIHAPADENPHQGYHSMLLSACEEYRAKLDKLEAENSALREHVEHLIGMIEQLQSDLAHFATIEAFEGKKEAKA